MNLSPSWLSQPASPASELPGGLLPRLVEAARHPVEAARHPVEAALCLLALALLWPLGMLIVLAIRLESPGGALYRQTRVGRGGREFVMLKFRSMQEGGDEQLSALLETCPARHQEWRLRQKLTADPRLTRVGAVLRRCSLDELPQLINVLRGEMSLVGPRPILPEQRSLYGPGLESTLQVSPGITGLWQVSGRADIPFAERTRLDALYLSQRCPALDLQILMRTIGVVIKGKGAY